jgi:hypothetical protein
MTSKKFVKQLMAMGMDRNTAAGKAKIYMLLDIDYAAAVVIEKTRSDAGDYYSSMVNQIAKAMQPTIEAAANIVEKVCEALNAIDWYALAAYVNERIAEAAGLAAGEVLDDE